MRAAIVRASEHTFTNSDKETYQHMHVHRMGRDMLTLVVDLAIAVDVGFTDHLIDLRVRQLLAYTHHDAQTASAISSSTTSLT